MKTTLTLIWLLMMAALPAHAAEPETIEMEYVDLQPGMDFYYTYHTRGQRIEPFDRPWDGLEGIPELDGNQAWFMRAQLGEGENNTFAMMVTISVDDFQNWTGKWIIDTNRNSDFSDDEVLSTSKFDRNFDFPSCDLMIPMKGKEVPHKSHLLMYHYEEYSIFYLHSDVFRIGKIFLDGETYDATLVDGNGNGLFNEADFYTDILFITQEDGEGNVKMNLDFSARSVVLNGNWHVFEPEPDGSLLHYKGTVDELATLRSQFNTINLKIESSHFGWTKLNTMEGKLRLPPGGYAWSDYYIYEEDKDGHSWALTCGTAMTMPLTVEQGENRLDLCLPVKQNISARTVGDQVIFDQKLIGRDGENVRIRHDNKAWEPSFAVEDLDGNVLLNARFDAG
jgi:hypothetical protein